MLATCFLSAALLTLGPAAATTGTHDAAARDSEPVSGVMASYVESRVGEFGMIETERKNELAELASYVTEKRASGEAVKLTFVCTHNSRRSHVSMIWAAVAANHFGVDGVTTYSGGTETTAFNPRAVAAIERAGLSVEKTTDAANPIYHVRYDEAKPSLTCFSKVYDQAPNPTEAFAAIMVCGDADENCPVVFGVEKRLAVRYVDPKAHDDTDREASAYDERSQQIAREMLYAFSLVE